MERNWCVLWVEYYIMCICLFYFTEVEHGVFNWKFEQKKNVRVIKDQTAAYHKHLLDKILFKII